MGRNQTYIQTLSESRDAFEADEINGFLASIENEGGRLNLTVAPAGTTVVSTTATPSGQVTYDAFFADAVSNQLDFGQVGLYSLDGDSDIPAALDYYELHYIDINNWALVETAANLIFDNVGAWTNVISTTGSVSPGDSVSIYTSTTNVDVLDFINFFDRNTPVDTPYSQASEDLFPVTNVSTSAVTEYAGYFERDLTFEGGLRAFTIASDDLVAGDIVRLRIYSAGDDKNDDSVIPLLDVRKQAQLSSAAASGTNYIVNDSDDVVYSFVQPERDTFIFTMSADDLIGEDVVGGLLASDSTGTTTTNLGFYFFTEAQLRIDRSSQVQAIGPTQVASDSVLLTPTEDIPIRMNIKVVDNGEIGEVHGDISQPFELPSTPEIDRALNYPLDDGGQRVNGAAQPIDVSVNNATQTLSQGQLYLERWDPVTKRYKANFESGIIPLADALGDRLMSGEDLTEQELIERGLFTEDETGVRTTQGLWDDLEHTYSMGNVVGSWAVNDSDEFTSQKFFYPFMDLGFDSEGRPKVPDELTLQRADIDTVKTTNIGFSNPFGDTLGLGEAFYRTIRENIANNLDLGINLGQLQGFLNSQVIIEPTKYFGEVGFGAEVQGYITHPSTPMRVDQFTPAVYIRTMFDKIGLIANKTFEFPGAQGSDWMNTMLNDMYVLPGGAKGLGVVLGEDFIDNGFVLGETTSGGATTIPITNINLGATSANRGLARDVYLFGEQTIHRSFPEQSPSYLNQGTFTAAEEGVYEFEFSGSFGNTTTFNSGTGFVRTRAVIQVNGQNKADHKFSEITDTGTELEEFAITLSIVLHKGDTVEAKIQRYRGRRAEVIAGRVVSPEFRTVKTPLIWEGKTCNLGLQFNQDTAAEWLGGITELLNLVYIPDKTRRGHYYVYQYYDWILSVTQNNEIGAAPRVDWSHRVDRETMEWSSPLREQEKTIIFTGADDDDKISREATERLGGEVYGSLAVSPTTNISASGEKTIGGFFGPLQVAQPNSVLDLTKPTNLDNINGIPHLYELDQGESKAMEFTPRIGYSKRIDLLTSPGASSFYYAAGDNLVGYSAQVRTLSSTPDGDPNVEELPDTNWALDEYSNSQATGAYQKYWKQYIDHLYDPATRKLTCRMLFNPEEYTDLPLNATVHLFGRDYLFNKIDGFNLSEPDFAMVELLSYGNNFTTVFTPMVNRFVEDPGDLYTFHLAIEVSAQTDPDNDNTLEPVADVFEQSSHRIVKQLAEDEPYEEVVNLRPNSNWSIQATDVADNTSEIAEVSVSYDDAANGGVDATITITGGSTHLLRKLVISPEVTPVASDSIAVTLVVEEENNSISNGIVATPPLTLSGRPGETIIFHPEFVPVNTSTASYELLQLGITDNSASIAGLTTSYADFGTGIRGTFTYKIPDGSTEPITIDTVNPVISSALLPVGTVPVITTVIFTENPSRTNVSIRDRVLRIPSVAGDGIDLDVYADAAFGYEIFSDEFSIAASTTGTQGTVVVRNGDQVGENRPQGSTTGFQTVRIPITLTAATSGEGEITVPVTMGDPEQVGTPRVSRTISYNPTNGTGTTSNDYTLSDEQDRFYGSPGDATLQNSHTLVITASPTEQISSVNVDSSSGVSNLTVQVAGRYASITFDVDASTNLTAIGAINFTVTTSPLPYRVTVNLVKNLDSIVLSRDSFSWGYSPSASPIALSEMNFTVRSNDPSRAFTTDDVISGSGSDVETSASANIETDSFSAGVISCNVDALIPANAAEDIVFAVPVNAGSTIQEGTPNSIDASSGTMEFGDLVNSFNPASSRGFPAYGGSFPIDVKAVGAWRITTTSGALRNDVLPNTGVGDTLCEITLNQLGPGISQGGFTVQLRSGDTTNTTPLDSYALNYGTSWGQPKLEISSSAPPSGTNSQIITIIS